MTKSIDTQLMKMADNHSKVTGTYFGVSFSGIVKSSRQHTVTYREQVTIELDREIEKPGNYMDGGAIIISARDIETKLHTIDGVMITKENKIFRYHVHLLPCPLCGSEAHKTIEQVEGFGDFSDYEIATVECENKECRLQMQDADSPWSHDIESRWNKRI